MRFFVKHTGLVQKYSSYVLLLLSLLFILSLGRNLAKIRGASSKIDKKRDQVEILKQEKDRLLSELEKVESEFYVEKQLRDNLGYAKEGDIVVVLPEPEVLRVIGQLKVENEEKLPDPDWLKWLKLFEIGV